MSPTVDNTDETTAVVTVTVPVAPGEAFALFADTSELARWFWPERIEARYSGSLTPSGELRVASDVIGMALTAPVTSVVPDREIACEWRWDGDDDVTTVHIAFGPVGGGTDVTVTHGANNGAEARDMHAQGWSDCLGRLEQLAGSPSS